MTIEEKAKAYDEALETARQIHNGNPSSGTAIVVCEQIFPELAESEDEKITRAINNMLPFIPDEAYANNGVTKEDVLNWLEKQKESLHISETCKENGDSFADEDEKIRKALINIVKGACGKYGIKCRADKVTEEKLFSYLEKQKDLDKMIVVSPEVWDKAINDAYENGKKDSEKQKDILSERAKNITINMLEDGIEGIQRELIEFLSNTINAPWVEVIKSADAYAQRIRSMVEKQKEQKPVDLSEMMVHKEPYIAPVPTPMVADEQRPAEWSEKRIADIFEKVGLAKIAREQGNDELINALQDAMLELSKLM